MISKDRVGPEKKKRLQNACDECKRRKIRCDSEMRPENICSSCITLGIGCTHEKTKRKRGPKPGFIPNRTAASQPVHVLVAEILSGTASDPIQIPEDANVTRKILIKLANRIQSLEGELKHVVSTVYQDSPQSMDSSPATLVHENNPPESVDPSDDPGDGDVDNLSQKLSQFSIVGLPSDTHFGESSNHMLMVSAMDHRKNIHGSSLPDWESIFAEVKRPQFWKTNLWNYKYTPPEAYPPLEFPPPADLKEAVDTFFDEYNIYNILLHQPTFEKSIAEGLHHRNDSFGALVLAVCALGMELRAFSNSEERPGNRWFNQIRLEKYVFSQRLELYHLQLYCICIFYLQAIASGFDLGWFLAGVAVRRAQEKGAHVGQLSMHSERPTLQGELWKRAFWMLIVIDTRMSTLFGRPRATSIQDFNLDPIVDCDDEYWETEDPKQAFVQPPGKPSIASFWNSYLKLTEIHGFALFTIYAVRKSDIGIRMGMGDIQWYEKAVTECDEALNEWMKSVPEHLKWENQKDTLVLLGQSTVLYSYYYWIQIQVHRMFIPQAGQSSGILSFQSLAICTNAARACLSVCEAQCVRKVLLYPHYLVAVFNSAMVLALNLARSTLKRLNFDPAREMRDIYRCIEIMRLYENKYQFVGRFVDQVNVIMYASNYPIRLPSEPSPPSSRSESVSNRADSNTNTTSPDTTDPQASQPDQTLQPEQQMLMIDPSQNTNIPFYTSQLADLPVHGSSPDPSFNQMYGGGDRAATISDPSLQQQQYSEDTRHHYYSSLAGGNGPYVPSHNNQSGDQIQSQNDNDQTDGDMYSRYHDASAAATGGYGHTAAGQYVPVVSESEMLQEMWRSYPTQPQQQQEQEQQISLQDWDSFMAGVDQLLNRGSSYRSTESQNNRFDSFNF